MKFRYCALWSVASSHCSLNGGDSVWNGRISNFKGLVTLILTSDRVIPHTVMHHSSTSTYTPNFTEIEETFVDGRTYTRTDERTFETYFLLGRLRLNFSHEMILRQTCPSTNLKTLSVNRALVIQRMSCK